MDEFQNFTGASGACNLFIGVVREGSKNEMVREKEHKKISGIYLEYYQSMTENAIKTILENALAKFPELNFCSLVHRIGYIKAGEAIMLVFTASQYRKTALEATDFLISFLKNQVPLWKKEIFADGSESWVEQKQSDRLGFRKYQN